MDIFDERYQGAMEKMSKTLGGIFSNLSDHWSRFQYMVMSSGLFDVIKNDAQKLLDIFNTMANNGELQKHTQKVAEVLKEVYGVIKEVVSFVWPVLHKVIVEIDKVAIAMGGWGEFIKKLGLIALVPIIISLSGALVAMGGVVASVVAQFMFASAILGPVGAIIAGINWPVLAVTVAIMGLIKSFSIWNEKIPIWKKIILTLVSPFLALWDAIKFVIDGIKTLNGTMPKVVVCKVTVGGNPTPINRKPKSGTRAGGGMVRAGANYLVGEGGRELFTPTQNGFITPNHRLGGNTGQHHIVIDLNLNQSGQLQLMGVQQSKQAPLQVNANLGRIR
jgi:hypothetical protein